MDVRGAWFGILSFCLLSPTVSVMAQTAPARPDTIALTQPSSNPEGRIIKTEKDKGLSKPGRAALYSAIIPGAGQFYNKDYLKIPFIYAIGGTIGYFIYWNNSNYQDYRIAYLASVDTNANTIPV